MPNDPQTTDLTPGEKSSIAWTGGFAVVFLAMALLTNSWSLLLLHTIAVGALGGLTHEFAQSGGKIFFFRKERDGLYFGSLAGMVLGIVAGLLVSRSYVDPPAPPTAAQPQVESLIPPDAAPRSIGIGLSLEIFFAALGLKGVAEAAGGTVAPGSESREDEDSPASKHSTASTDPAPPDPALSDPVLSSSPAQNESTLASSNHAPNSR